ncbi:MAG: N-acetylmuramoyl-L-alanine amidase [Gammaproteobacteria bacterium]|nr:N-acetylmuramoyl-L-alanine amidase [Gammaproteobacteria bacterium]|tara:strand:+ start:2933 stop:4186 length:1254 start_codon:yes stop_codon:yes gene_type:complete
MKNLLALLIIFTISIDCNEINSIQIEEIDRNTFKLSMSLQRVALIKSYSRNSDSQIIMELYDTNLETSFEDLFNYPIKKVSVSSEDNLTRVVLDLYENVYWKKPEQIKLNDNILLSLVFEIDKNLNRNTRDIVIAIDAGHGGKDPGSVGGNNILEKDVTLLIAKELERTLRDTYGYRPIMMRGDDNFISLNDRYMNARKLGADALISIHADGFRLTSVKGASVIVWSDEASSSITRNLSNKERKRIQNQIKNIKEYEFDEDAAKTKYPEIYNKKIENSVLLGNKILNELKNDPYTKIHKKNVEFADFRVLKSVDIPSVLVESGFITNPEDAKRLKEKAGRRMIARSIFLGLHEYFLELPPSGSLFEVNKDYLIYEIQTGDVLSEIAIRFGVSIKTLEEYNKLQNKNIYPGQKILIPI